MCLKFKVEAFVVFDFSCLVVIIFFQFNFLREMLPTKQFTWKNNK